MTTGARYAQRSSGTRGLVARVRGALRLAAAAALIGQASATVPSYAQTTSPGLEYIGPVGDRPEYLTVNPATKRLYVTRPDSNAVARITEAGGSGGVAAVGRRPQRAAVNATTNRIYVANVDDQSVAVLDGATEVVMATIPLGGTPSHVAVNPTTNRVYVSRQHSPGWTEVVTVIDGATSSIVGTLETQPPFACGSCTSSTAGALAINSTTNRVYVANPFAGTVVVFDGASGAILETISVGRTKLIGVNPATDRLYSAYDGRLNAVDLATGTIVRTMSLPAGELVGLEVSRATNRVYVASNGSARLMALDGVTHGVIFSLTLDWPLKHIAVNPTSGRAYLLGWNGGLWYVQAEPPALGDTTPPIIAGFRTLAANASGWNNADVTVTFTCADADSGLASCGPTPRVVSTEGRDQAVTGTAVDQAGNSATATVGAINIDKTPPSTTATPSVAPNGQGWNNTNVSVTLAATDSLSGVASIQYRVGAGGGWTTYAGQIILSTDGTHDVLYRATDAAGNVESQQSLTVRIDKTAPAVTVSPDRPADVAGWYTRPVTATPSGTDALSGIGACTPVTYSGPDGPSATAAAGCTDRAGNAGSGMLGLKYDGSAPVTTAGLSPQPNGAGWNNADVTVTLTATDGAGSGVKNLTYSATGAQPVASTTVAGATASVLITKEGTTTITFSATDDVGHIEAAKTVTIKFDKTASKSVSASYERPIDYDGYYNRPVIITFSGTDTLSGMASCTSVTYSGPDSSSASVTGTCTDLAGNATVKSESFKYDATAPTTTAALSSPANADGWHTGNVTVTLTATDNVSGAKDLTYSASGAQTIPTTTVTPGSKFVISAEGETTISYFARDKAANLETAKTLTIRIGKP